MGRPLPIMFHILIPLKGHLICNSTHTHTHRVYPNMHLRSNMAHHISWYNITMQQHKITSLTICIHKCPNIHLGMASYHSSNISCFIWTRQSIHQTTVALSKWGSHNHGINQTYSVIQAFSPWHSTKHIYHIHQAHHCIIITTLMHQCMFMFLCLFILFIQDINPNYWSDNQSKWNMLFYWP